MKIGWALVFGGSLLALAFVLVRSRLSWSWLQRFGLHLAAAAFLIYVLNYSGWIAGYDIPLNPTTVGTVMALGMPGVMLILGLQWTLLS